MGRGLDGPGGVWEILKNQRILWVQEGYSTLDVFLAHSSKLIHGTGRSIRILHLDGKDLREAPHGWNHDLLVPATFSFTIEGTTGVGIGDSLFLVGGKRNPRSGLRLDLRSGEWMPLPDTIRGREKAALVMWDPHNILILGGRDPEKDAVHSSCERLDTRQGQWSPFPRDIPLPVQDHAAALLDGHVYISGGFRDEESLGEAWRCRANGEGPWDPLPSLRFNRHLHGMMGDGAGRLQVVGGRHEKVGEWIVEVLSTEVLNLDEGRGWERQQELPFVRVLKASGMECVE
ncbi:unnamed protein product [Darwinula stevensoni]|uniref:Kelch repeat-containing protein n=1 Tax=Darwinula stevensoni TaxID=69355 RepID=A0A7R8XCS1_9CRUS|nr:unnamed protein product [Darwinula stevensoni]CAG0892287.1 unnamed protein product [Darwinula stevensoni]